MMKISFFLLFLLSYATLAALEPQLGSVTVKTRANENRTVTVHYRVPRDYDAKRTAAYRVLVIFGGRNTAGISEARGSLGWDLWADQEEVFLVAPGFKNDEYWMPGKWSGKALFDALTLIQKQYNINTTKLLYYGYSAGSQCANLFPAWRPSLTRAWVSHACGVFHEPVSAMRGIPGLVTCGDADSMRYIISRTFVENCRKRGISIIWRSFPNHPHDVPPDSLRLAREFLSHYHREFSADLKRGATTDRVLGEKIVYIGDDQEGVFYSADSPKAKNVYLEDRVYLPTFSIADAWGKFKE